MHHDLKKGIDEAVVHRIAQADRLAGDKLFSKIRFYSCGFYTIIFYGKGNTLLTILQED